MLTVTEARERILSHFSANPTENIPLASARNRILAADIFADGDHPPFDNSAVDGFALRAEDTSASSVTLNVVADIPAGTTPKVSLQPGEAARIMTGAQLPHGADSVIMVEDTGAQHHGTGTNAPNTVTLAKQMQAGENIRTSGSDIRAGEMILKQGRTLKAQDLGMLAVLGVAEVPVYQKARVALLSSGDELLDVNEPLQPGKI